MTGAVAVLLGLGLAFGAGWSARSLYTGRWRRSWPARRRWWRP